MRTISLPGVGVPVTQLVLGTMTFGDTADADTARAMVDTAIDGGITSFDTANGYAAGASEQILGAALVGRRDEVTIATKAGIYAGDAQGFPLLSEPGMRSSLEASLQRLGTDRVDLYYLHMPDRSVPLAETVAALGAFVQEGLIAAYGVSNYAAWQIADLTAVADSLGVPRPVIAQQLYNLVARTMEDEYAEFAQTHDLATIVYNPLGGGLLTGRHSFSEQPTEGRYGSSALASMYRDRYWNSSTFAAIERLSAIAEEAGVRMPELALRWLFSRAVVSAVLLGGSKTSQLEANLAAASAGPLPDDVTNACDEAVQDLRGLMPRYNR
jgi:aryl-alcohol dehydrogenase-like predicted oxidoreductase